MTRHSTGTVAPNPSAYRIAPALLVRGDDVLAEVAPLIAAWGRRILLVGGEMGVDQLPSTVREGLDAANVEVHETTHVGPCSPAAVARIRLRAEAIGADAVLAVGGGRVLDAAKVVADDLEIPCATLPTSPATCAAVTPVSVMYDADGRYLSAHFTRRAPDLAMLDLGLLSQAPNRLLAAGILDAIAKVHEVRRTTRDADITSAGARAALAVCDDLEALLAGHAEPALSVGPRTHDVRVRVAEACVLTPGLIGGMAGEAAKLAAAHPLHNALTAIRGSHTALHGELVGFGVLVQLDLEGRGDDAVFAEAARFARLGVACHLDALGCSEARGAAGRAVAQETVATAAMRATFPDVTAEAFLAAMMRVDDASRSAWAAATA